MIHALQLAHTEHINDSLVDGFISYLANANEPEDLFPLFNRIQTEVPFYGENIMTYAEALEQRGMQKGIQEGIQKAQKEIAQQLLKSGVDSRVIATATHLTAAQIEELKESLH